MRFFDHRREHARTDWDNQRPAAAGVGGAAGRGAASWPTPPATCRYRLAQGDGRQGRLQPGHGGDPRAPRRQGAGPAQRPAERALDRRQQPLHPDVQGVRHPRAGTSATATTLLARHRCAPASASPSPTTAPTPPSWRPAPCARTRDGVAGLAHQRREDVDHRHARGHPRHGLRPHLAARTATPPASPASSSPPTRRA